MYLPRDDFSFNDPLDNDQFAALTIVTVPESGMLSNNGSMISAGSLISVSDIDAGLLQYTAPVNVNGQGFSGFAFLEHDSGDAANSGEFIDQTPNLISFDFPAVNDPPLLFSEGTIVDEGDEIVISTDALTAIDVDDSPAELTVKLNSVPAHGELIIGGIALVVGDTFTVEQLQ